MPFLKSKKIQKIIPLILIILFNTFFYFLFRTLDKANQTWDSAGHIALTIRITENLKKFSIGESTIYEIFTESNYYPPLFHFIVGFLNLIFGYNQEVQLFWIFLSFIISLVVFYLLLKEFGFSDKVSYLTIFIYSLFPLVADQYRTFHLESPLILFILTSFYYLKKSKNYLNFKYTVLFFIFLAGTQLIKWYGFLYLIVPSIYFLIEGLKNTKNRKIVLKNILISLLIFLALCLPWYLLNFREIVLLSSLFSRGELDDLTLISQGEGIWYYLKASVAFGTYFVPTILGFVGLLALYLKNKKYSLLLLLQILIVYSFFTNIENKNLRYVFGLYTIWAFLIAYLIDILNKKWLEITVLCYLILGFLISSFNQFKSYSSDSNIWSYVFAGPAYDWYASDPKVYSYNSYKAPVEEIIDFIIRDAEIQNISDIGISPLVDTNNISVATLEMFIARKETKNLYLPAPYFQFTPFKSDYEILKFFRDKNASYVLVPENPGPDGIRNKKALVQSIDFMKNRSSEYFELIKKIDILDNSIEIYRIKTPENQIKLNNCVLETNISDKTYEISPLSSLLFFTGKFSISGVEKNYYNDNLYMLEATNYSLENKFFKFENLPQEGYTVCQRLGTKLRVKKEIAKSLLQDTKSCGDKTCQTVTHYKFNIENTLENSNILYDSNFFLGSSIIEKQLKSFKVVPLYENEYKLIDEIYSEKNK
jgi:4-amino-4-deoxy-L-arabinose transferase-like glycosyltransferase